VLSALGMALAGFRRDFARTLLLQEPHLSWERLQEEFSSLRRFGLAEVKADGLDPERLAAAGELELRYPGQSYTLTVPLAPNFRAEFHDRHRRLYGHAFSDRELEAVVLRLHLSMPSPDTGLPVLAPVGRRRFSLPRSGTVWLPQGPVTAPLYYRPALSPGSVFSGPALVLEDHSTLLVLDGFQGEVLDQGHVRLRW
jgi:N-methylhydantoinase A